MRLRSTERGATMLEFSIVGGVLFLLILGLFDIGRYLLVLNLANHAARSIVDEAKVDAVLGRDVRFIDGTLQAKRFNTARQRIIQDGLSTVAIPAGGLLSLYEMPDADLKGSTVSANALLLMPGESATRYPDGIKHGDGIWIRHPTCYECPEFNDNSRASFELLRTRHGIYAEVTVSLPLFIAGNNTIAVVGEATGWQEPDPGFHLGLLPDTAEPTTSCKLISEAEACAQAGCNPATQRCQKYDNWTTPKCAFCHPLTCGAYWKDYEQKSGVSFCQAAGCPNSDECRFQEDMKLDAVDSPEKCGDCGGKLKCKDITTADAACQIYGCAIGVRCMFDAEKPVVAGAAPSECASCRQIMCSIRTTEAAACAPLDCASKGKECYFMANYFGDECAVCTDNQCNPPPDGCPDGVWSGKPYCKCCKFKDCSGLDNPAAGEKYVFNSQLCECVLEPDDSTGDMQ